MSGFRVFGVVSFGFSGLGFVLFGNTSLDIYYRRACCGQVSGTLASFGFDDRLAR